MMKLSKFLLTYYLSLVIILLSIREISSVSFSEAQQSVIFENCAVFNSSNLYGGEICGTDGQRYSNSMYLDCLNHKQGTDVATWHQGDCRAGEEYCEANVLYEPICGSDNQTWSNLESLLCHRRVRNSKIRQISKGVCTETDVCARRGFHIFGLNPVCGNNGYTYQNIAQLKCMQKANPELQIVHDGGCVVKTVAKLYPEREQVCHIAKNRYEWNPVCGADNITYSNPFVFLCNNPELQVRSNSECHTPSHEACMKANEREKMIDGERVNDFDPDHEVCGNDGRTYRSNDHVRCHSINNKYLYTKHEGACVGPDDNPCNAIPEEDRRFPICGSDGVTYVSPEALWCAKRRQKISDLAFVHDGRC